MSALYPHEILVFLGPSLSQNEATKICQATYLPPAKQGDIASLVSQRRPKVIALIDGYFLQTLSVWHREILYALDQRVVVFGASSMGALRAAELDSFGMKGIGAIYEMYRKKELTDDDEVTLIHGPSETNYIHLSLPMVNIRFTLAKAKAEEKITPLEYDEWVALAKSLYYPERTLPILKQLAQKKGRSLKSIDAICHLFEHHYVDQKKNDAMLLLKTLHNLVLSPEEKPHFTFHHTPIFNEFFQFERKITVKEIEFSLSQLNKHVSLHHPSYGDLYLSAIHRFLANFLARILRIEVTTEEITQEKERFYEKMHFDEHHSFQKWLKNNHLEEDEFCTLMKKRAEARKIFRSQSLGHISWKLTQMILEELKLSNQYEEWVASLISQEELLKEESPYFDEVTHSELQDNSALLASHLKETSWNLDTRIEDWLEEGGFVSIEDLSGHVLRAKKVREFLEKKLKIETSEP